MPQQQPDLSGGSMGATTARWYSRTSGVGGLLPGRCRWPSVRVGLESLLPGPVGVPMLRSGLSSWLPPPPLLLLLATAAATAASAAAASASIAAALALPCTLLRYWLHAGARGSQMVSSAPPASSASGIQIASGRHPGANRHTMALDVSTLGC